MNKNNEILVKGQEIYLQSYDKISVQVVDHALILINFSSWQTQQLYSIGLGLVSIIQKQ